jgi:hypothetical protein
MAKNTEQLPLWTTSRQEIVATFDADHTTSDAGVVLLNRIDAKLNVAARLAGAIRDRRNLLFVTHTMSTLLRQRLFQIAMGWQDCNDAASLRSDPFYRLACGRQPVSGEDLASQPTLSRLENAVDDADVDRMRDVLLDLYLDRHRCRRHRKLIILDVDVTDAETHGRQQMSFFNSYYGHTCLTPLLVNDGESGDLISATLRPGNAGTGDKLLDELERIVPRLREIWPKAKILLRADAGFAWPGIFEFCDANGLDYLIATRSTSKLDTMAASTLWQAQLQAAHHDDTRRCFGSGTYRSSGWKAARRVIWKAEAKPGATDVRFVVTTLPGSPRALYERYCERGQAENWIKAFKSALHGDRMSCTKATANHFRLLLHAAAYQMMLSLRELLAGTEAETWQFDTLRLRLLKVGGWVRQTARRITLHLASSHPHRDLWTLLSQRLCPA